MNSFQRISLTSFLLKLLTIIWVISLLMVILTLATPLEFVPLTLGNIPRWVVWGLAFPACHQLWVRTGRLRWFWKSLPWLLWAPLVLVEGMVVWDTFHGSYHTTFWERALQPVELVFANQNRWAMQHTLFRRGALVVVHELCWHPQEGVVDLRQAKLVPLLPGLQWATRLSTDFQPGVVDASWQLVDTVHVGMSQDTTLQRQLKPWLLKHNEL